MPKRVVGRVAPRHRRWRGPKGSLVVLLPVAGGGGARKGRRRLCCSLSREVAGPERVVGHVAPCHGRWRGPKGSSVVLLPVMGGGGAPKGRHSWYSLRMVIKPLCWW